VLVADPLAAMSWTQSRYLPTLHSDRDFFAGLGAAQNFTDVVA
jgi:hypothetical protein